VSSGTLISDAQNELISAIIGEKQLKQSKVYITSFEWYMNFLEAKIREAWVPLFQPVMRDIHPFADTPCDQDISVAFRFFAAIVQEFRSESLALVDIVDVLYNKPFLKETDENRSHAHQLVFAAFGWTSTLLLSSSNGKISRLTIARLSIYSRGKSRCKLSANHEAFRCNTSRTKRFARDESIPPQIKDIQQL